MKLDITLFGTIKFYDPIKQFGFVNSDSGIDFFFNSNNLQGRTVKNGDRVTFTPDENKRGLLANRIHKL